MANKQPDWVDRLPLGKHYHEQDIEKMRMNVRALTDDLGGVVATARIVEKWSTTVSKWVKRGYMDTRALGLIKSARPDIDLNKYFE